MEDDCKKDNKVHICLRKVVNVKSLNNALLCFNPRCVTEEWKKAIGNQEKSNDPPLCTNLRVDIEKKETPSRCVCFIKNMTEILI